PHPSLGHARRMQVAQPHLQHRVMIEAVENHMPEVIIIDEIGTEAEAGAARTIAERGVQLIGTAHGISLENLVLNPTLADLVGGVQAVTLGDEEARRRRTRKTVLERKAPPTFDIVVEIRSREQVAIHTDVARTVDQLLRGVPLRPLLRTITASGQVVPVQPPAPTTRLGQPEAQPARRNGQPVPPFQAEEEPGVEESLSAYAKRETTDLFPYGIGRGRLEETLHTLNLPLRVVENLHTADVLVTTRQMYRRKAQPIGAAEEAGIPVYVLRKNTPLQLEEALRAISGARGRGDPAERALEETERAIDRILSGQASEVDLSPQNAYMRRLQHQLAEEYGLNSRSSGREPNRRVRLFRSPVGVP
ncbi:MAG: AAA family ATPase, partial [Chloroflexi bacterium]|nr:AAA family ATPase [Chloroflexota bacterium]